jgi:flagellar protein FliO/FliZ
MNAFKSLTIPIILASSLVCNVYAGAPAYISTYLISSADSGILGFFRTIYYLLMIALILAAAYYVTKFLARRSHKQHKTRSLKLIESMSLGVDRNLHIVKAGNQYFLIGSASKNIVLLSELDREMLFSEQQGLDIDMETFNIDEYEDGVEGGLEGKDFDAYLSSVKGNLKKLKNMVRGKNGEEE